jgi:type IV fimbrial biogenesis protein FimT
LSGRFVTVLAFLPKASYFAAKPTLVCIRVQAYQGEKLYPGDREMMQLMSQKHQHGISLVELLGTLSIVAIVNALAGPTLSETFKRNQLRSAAERVMTTLNLARSEAVKRNQPVSVCRSSNGTSCTGDWQDGWIVFSNIDGDNAVDAGSDEVIRVYEGLDGGHGFDGTVGSNAITYFSDGSYARGSETIKICPKDGDLGHTWMVDINTVGRPRVTRGESGCS